MACRSFPTKRRRSHLLRTVGGLFAERPVQPEALVAQSPPVLPGRPADSDLATRKVFKRRAKRPMDPGTGSRILGTKLWNDPPPEYSVLGNVDHEQHPALRPQRSLKQRPSGSVDLSALPQRDRVPHARHATASSSTTSSGPSTLLERLRYVDEMDARSPHDSPIIDRLRTSPETISERPSQEGLGDVVLPAHSVSQTRLNTAFNTTGASILEPGGIHAASPQAAHAAVRRTSRTHAARYSDGSSDFPLIVQPVPVRPSPLSAENLLASSGSDLVRALYAAENAEQTKFDADIARGLGIVVRQEEEEEEEEEEKGCGGGGRGKGRGRTGGGGGGGFVVGPLDADDEDEWTGLVDRHWALTGTRTCCICNEQLDQDEFPALVPPTPRCDHANNTCAHCLRRWILSALEGGRAAVTCPECREPLSSEDARRAVLLHF